MILCCGTNYLVQCMVRLGTTVVMVSARGNYCSVQIVRSSSSFVDYSYRFVARIAGED